MANFLPLDTLLLAVCALEIQSSECITLGFPRWLSIEGVFTSYMPECRVWQWRTQEYSCKPKIAHLGTPQNLKLFCLCGAPYNFCIIFGHPHLRCRTVGAPKILSRSAILWKLGYMEEAIRKVISACFFVWFKSFANPSLGSGSF